MCGIAGWIDWERDLTTQKHVLEKMTTTLSHRGPDAEGTWLSPCAALGHRRLTVIDPVGGSQPMVRQLGDSTYVITYNGELYNTAELRRELELYGHKFQSHSDTEVLLVSFIQWGPSCIDRLNGIFAFAVWDHKEQRLFLARDRLGVKPLFYTHRGRTLLFGSELKALLAHPEVKPQIDAEGLAEIFYLGPSRTPGHGVFRNIREVRPGHCLIYDRSGIHMRRYWNVKSKPHRDDLDTTAAKVHDLLKDSVQRQLISDVPICTLLSGGLDSSALTAFAAQSFSGQLHTYSIDYVNNNFNFKPNEFQPTLDAPWVKHMSRYCGTRHHYITVDTPEIVDALTNAVLARDLPGMADVDSSLYLFCREIKKNATVALSGECADEIFGGYPWFHSQEALNSSTFPWLRALQFRTSLLSPELLQYVNPDEYINQRYQDTLAEVPKLPGENEQESRRREMFYLNILWFMTTLLDRKDRMSMATGLEVRVPFCDHRLVEYVWNIPWQMKNWNGQEKGILRRALAGILPEGILNRRKSPYPKTHNPHYLAAVRNWLIRILEDPASPLLPLVNTNALRSLTRVEGDTFNRPWFGQLMTGPQLFAYLCQIDTWLREYKVEIC
ncbi:asparagine synthase (glutamine-hydrolyzing) [Desulfohalotomaculum tongense]|uniref:asparagine synthase (glutamine-hydrolyzing) n=1 Tax=Desulforadius tongensis TaxID=1216062 RepID=UPI00195C9006|nr:asparagine synthase (glutamine-hydrolyzing) [Desulforadius tongensis]MBM7856160.1 asparagine synthase (glutamine-hydrolyzing) [Desulforadius tongensis]